MKVTYSIKFQWSISEIGTPLHQGSSKCLCTCSGLLKLVWMQSINVDNSDFIWPHLVIIRQKMYQWKIETKPQDVNVPLARDPNPSCEWSARCLPRWRAKHCPVELRSRSSSTLQNPATVHTFKSRAVWNINRNDCITLIDNAVGKTQESRDHAQFTCFYALYSNNLEKKTWEIQVLSKSEFLNACFLTFFNCSWPARIIS